MQDDMQDDVKLLNDLADWLELTNQGDLIHGTEKLVDEADESNLDTWHRGTIEKPAARLRVLAKRLGQT